MAEQAINDTQRGYSRAMRIIHWLMAACMVVVFACMPLYNATKNNLFYDLHRSMGFVILVLVLIRLCVKFTSQPPSPLGDSIPRYQRIAAKFTHIALYVLLIVHPILGWVGTNIWGVKHIPFFGIWHLPQLAEKNRPLGEKLLGIHHELGHVILILVVIHVAAALYHHFIKKDDVLKRMTGG